MATLYRLAPARIYLRPETAKEYGLIFTALTILSLVLSSCLIQGKVTQQNIPSPGVILALEDSNGQPIAWAETNQKGKFQFRDVQEGTFTVRPSADGYVFTPPFITVEITDAPVLKTDFEAQSSTTDPGDPIRIMFTGDIMLARKVETVVDNIWRGPHQERYQFPFQHVADTLSQADILFGNLESVVSDMGEQMQPPFLCCSFRADPDAIFGLEYAGYDIVSVANNHSGDFGPTALMDSLTRLAGAGIMTAGAGEGIDDARRPTVMVREGIRVAYLAYNQFGNYFWPREGIDQMVAKLSKANLAEDIPAARNQADIVVVSMHYGKEYAPLPSETQESLSKYAIDLGATVVVGHHPHVTQPTVSYKNGLIAYSLGNFVFDQSNPDTWRGKILEAIVDRNGLLAYQEIEIEINDQYQPVIVPSP